MFDYVWRKTPPGSYTIFGVPAESRAPCLHTPLLPATCYHIIAGSGSDIPPVLKASDFRQLEKGELAQHLGCCVWFRRSARTEGCVLHDLQHISRSSKIAHTSAGAVEVIATEPHAEKSTNTSFQDPVNWYGIIDVKPAVVSALRRHMQETKTAAAGQQTTSIDATVTVGDAFVAASEC